MKYDDGYAEDAREKAEAAKKEGNKFFQLGKYRWAVDAYSNGIKARCTDKALVSQLYGNRAAAHRRLQNLGSAVKDSLLAWKCNPGHRKAALRAGECLLQLGHVERCLAFLARCRAGLDAPAADEEAERASAQFRQDLERLEEQAKAKLQAAQRDERRRKAEQRRAEAEKRRLLGALKERGYRFRPAIDLDKPDEFELADVTIRSPFTQVSEGRTRQPGPRNGCRSAWRRTRRRAGCSGPCCCSTWARARQT